MSKETIKQKLKTVGKTILVASIVSALGTAAYVVFNKPKQVKNACPRTYHRADGKPKVAYNSAQRANWQAVKQLFLHGEVCNPYQAPNGKYYTGHSKNAIIKSINPLKYKRYA